MNNAAINIHVQVSVWTYVLFCFSNINLGVVLLGHNLIGLHKNVKLLCIKGHYQECDH